MMLFACFAVAIAGLTVDAFTVPNPRGQQSLATPRGSAVRRCTLRAARRPNTAPSDDEKSPTAAELSRRQLLDLGLAALTAPALGGLALASSGRPALAAEAAVDVKYVLPLAELLADLASSPPRDVVITGANSGVGLAGAKLLTAAGHRVLCACRTQAKADAAAQACLAFAASGPATILGIQAPMRPGGTASGLECDLADLLSVRSFAAKIKADKTRKVDTLVLNAGLAMNTGDKEARYTADGFELTVGTNHLGHFLLANLLLPELDPNAAVPPRLVITGSPVHDPNSGGGNVGSKATLGDLSGLEAAATTKTFDMVDGGAYDPDKAYKDSKLCNLLFMAEAARRFKGVAVDAFSPGLIPSPDGFFRYQNKGFAKTFEKISGFAGVSETNDFAGAALAYMATEPTLPLPTGGWYDTYPPGKHQLAVHSPSLEAGDPSEQAKLWDLSAKLVGLA